MFLVVSLYQFLVAMCALQLHQALLGSCRLLFEILPLLQTNFLSGDFKSSCVWSSFEQFNERD